MSSDKTIPDRVPPTQEEESQKKFEVFQSQLLDEITSAVSNLPEKTQNKLHRMIPKLGRISRLNIIKAHFIFSVMTQATNDGVDSLQLDISEINTRLEAISNMNVSRIKTIYNKALELIEATKKT